MCVCVYAVTTTVVSSVPSTRRLKRKPFLYRPNVRQTGSRFLPRSPLDNDSAMAPNNVSFNYYFFIIIFLYYYYAVEDIFNVLFKMLLTKTICPINFYLSIRIVFIAIR